MSIYDISLSITESIVVWPGDAPVRIRRTSSLEEGDSATVSRLELGAHTGTHVDAPAHFVKGGSTVEQMDLKALVGPALVVEVPDVEALSADVLAELAIPLDARRVLFHTRNSELWMHGREEFAEDFVAIPEDGAQWLVERGIRLVGIDYLSVAPYRKGVETHKRLLEAGIVLVEGLNLSGIAQGSYLFVCLPLKLESVEGAPARAILVDSRMLEELPEEMRGLA